jgi:hypothetical protein
MPGWCEASLSRQNTEHRTQIQEDCRRVDTGELCRVVEAQSKNKTEEERLDTDLLTEFVQGASKSGSVEDFVCVKVYELQLLQALTPLNETSMFNFHRNAKENGRR